MGERIRRIEVDRLLEQVNRPLQPLLGPLAREMASSQVEIVSVDARGGFPHQRRGRFHEPGPQRLDDRVRQLVFDHEDVPELPVVRLRPQMVAVRCIHELRSDPHGAAFAPDAPLEDGGDGKLLTDRPYAHVLPLERERGGARDHVKTFHVGERVDHFLGYAVREVLVILLSAHVHERQHGDRGRSRCVRMFRQGWCGPAREEVPAHARCGDEEADSDEDQREPDAREAGARIRPWRRGPLDAARRHVERPGKEDDDGEACTERHDHEGQRPLWKMERMRDGLGYLQHREGRDAVRDQRAKHAPALELGEQGYEH